MKYILRFTIIFLSFRKWQFTCFRNNSHGKMVWPENLKLLHEAETEGASDC